MENFLDQKGQSGKHPELNMLAEVKQEDGIMTCAFPEGLVEDGVQAPFFYMHLARVAQWHFSLGMVVPYYSADDQSYGKYLAQALLTHGREAMAFALNQLHLVRASWHLGRLEGFSAVTDGLRYEMGRLEQNLTPGRNRDMMKDLLRRVDFRLNFTIDDYQSIPRIKIGPDKLALERIWAMARPEKVDALLSLEPTDLELPDEELLDQALLEIFRCCILRAEKLGKQAQVTLSADNKGEDLLVYVRDQLPAPGKLERSTWFEGFVRGYPDLRLFDVRLLLVLAGGGMSVSETPGSGKTQFQVTVPREATYLPELGPIHGWVP